MSEDYGINFPIDVRISQFDDEDNISGYGIALFKELVNPGFISVPDFIAQATVGAVPFLGEIRFCSLPDVPLWYLECDGSEISRESIYGIALVSSGCPYGAGNGTTTVNIPDMRMRSPEGRSGGLNPLGTMRGAETKVLSVDNLPAHHHVYDVALQMTVKEDPTGSPVYPRGFSGWNQRDTQNTGSGVGVEVVGPRTAGIFVVYVAEDLS